jgi:flagellum-specific peptidoglycan hydrolase FlgJ
MLYTYCKESLSFRKVTPTRKLGIVALVIFAGIYLSMTSMVTNAKQQAYKEAFNLPAETELVILDITEDQFTQGQLVEELKRLNVRYPYIVLAQSILETGYWESRIYQENNNLFGMKQARARATTAKGTQLGHAYYDNWKESVTDYALYQAAYLNKLRSESKYLKYLDKNYAEAKNYDDALLTIIERENLKELFLD